MHTGGEAVLKRAFDIIASGVALVLLAPLGAVIAVVVKVDSPGPVLYRQRRLGERARAFEMLKFRTMVVDAEAKGPGITLGDDPRITRAGRLLRRFDLDELPTLLNVFRGDMSIVGPRPEIPKYLEYYTEEQRRVFLVKPGLTDPATLAFRDESALLLGSDAEQVYVREVLPRKLALSLAYVDRRTFLGDLGIIFRTLFVIPFQAKG
jgi:lipopolysaccharide/colanic/teichoic acid biosynthesis glycosyltransferase